MSQWTDHGHLRNRNLCGGAIQNGLLIAKLVYVPKDDIFGAVPDCETIITILDVISLEQHIGAASGEP